MRPGVGVSPPPPVCLDLRIHAARELSGIVCWPLSSTAPWRASITPPPRRAAWRHGSSTVRREKRHHSPRLRAPKRHHSPRLFCHLRNSRQTVRAKRGTLAPRPFFLASRIHSGLALGSTPQKGSHRQRARRTRRQGRQRNTSRGVYQSAPPIPGSAAHGGQPGQLRSPDRIWAQGTITRAPVSRRPPLRIARERLWPLAGA